MSPCGLMVGTSNRKPSQGLVEKQSMTVWVFQFTGKSWKRKTLAWYNRFLAGEEKIVAAELMVAHVYLETENREPKRVALIEYEKHELNSDGCIDKVVELSKLVDAVNLLPNLDQAGPSEGNVIDATQRFAQRRVGVRKWQPSPGQENLLMQKLAALDVPL